MNSNIALICPPWDRNTAGSGAQPCNAGASSSENAACEVYDHGTKSKKVAVDKQHGISEPLPVILFHYPVRMTDVFKMGCCNVNVNWVMVPSMKKGENRPFKLYAQYWAAKC
jgi:hypothetical protein